MTDKASGRGLDCPLLDAGLASIEYTEFSVHGPWAGPEADAHDDIDYVGREGGCNPAESEAEGSEDAEDDDDMDIDLVEEEILEEADPNIADTTIGANDDALRPYTLRLLNSSHAPPYPKLPPPWNPLAPLLSSPRTPKPDQYPSYTFSRFIDWQLAEPPSAQLPLSHPDTISAWPIVARHIPFFRRIQEVDVDTDDGWKTVLILKRCMRGKLKDDWVPPFLYRSVLSCQGCRDDNYPCIHSSTGPPTPSHLPDIYLPIQCLPCIQAERFCQFVLPPACNNGNNPFRRTAILAKLDPESTTPATALEAGMIIPAPSRHDIPPHLRRMDDPPVPGEERESFEIVDSALGGGWCRIRSRWRTQHSIGSKNSRVQDKFQVKMEKGEHAEKELPGVTMLRLTLGRKAVTEHQRRLEMRSRDESRTRQGRLSWSERMTREERKSGRKSWPPLAPRAMLSTAASSIPRVKREAFEEYGMEHTEHKRDRSNVHDLPYLDQRPSKRSRIDKESALLDRTTSHKSVKPAIQSAPKAIIHHDRLALKRTRLDDDSADESLAFEKKGKQRTGANTSELTGNRWGVKPASGAMTTLQSSDRKIKARRTDSPISVGRKVSHSAQAPMTPVSPITPSGAPRMILAETSPERIQSMMDDILNRISPMHAPTAPGVQREPISPRNSMEEKGEPRAKGQRPSDLNEGIVCRGRGERKALREDDTWWEENEVRKSTSRLIDPGQASYPTRRGKRIRTRSQSDTVSVSAVTVHLGIQPSHPIPTRPSQFPTPVLPAKPNSAPFTSPTLESADKADKSKTKDDMRRAADWKLMLVKNGLSPQLLVLEVETRGVVGNKGLAEI